MHKLSSGAALSLAALLTISSTSYAAAPTLNDQVGNFTSTALTSCARITALGALFYAGYHGARSVMLTLQSATTCENTDEIVDSRNVSLAKTVLGLGTAGIAHGLTKIQWTGLLFRIDIGNIGTLVGGLLNYLAHKK